MLTVTPCVARCTVFIKYSLHSGLAGLIACDKHSHAVSCTHACMHRCTHIIILNSNNKDFISIALFHVKHSQLR